MKKLIIYADGACRNNQAKNKDDTIGGWGYIIKFKNQEDVGEISHLEDYGGCRNTTNNQMELTSVIKALDRLNEAYDIDLFTDSNYVCQGMNTWINGWIKNNWKTATKKPVANVELWQELYKISKRHKITWNWIKGHSDDKLNQYVDALANKGCDSIL